MGSILAASASLALAIFPSGLANSSHPPLTPEESRLEGKKEEKELPLKWLWQPAPGEYGWHFLQMAPSRF